MLIAHFPMGYLESKIFTKLRFANTKAIMPASIIGNMIPDLDMLYFHFVDGRKTNHHDYITHWPIFWAAVACVILIGTWSFKPKAVLPALAFSIGTFLHMTMDSFAAPIHWLAPFSMASFEMFHVPATHSNWIGSFITHWTFMVEIGICVAATWVFWLGRITSAK
jgi:inner membrane protein